MSVLGGTQSGWNCKGLHFDPLGFRDLGRSGQSSASNDNFVVNFGRNVNAREKLIHKVKAAKLCENNQGR